MTKLRTCLWFEANGEEAARFYVSLLPNSTIDSIFRREESEPPLVIEFTLDGVPYMILNGGPYQKLSEAVSISVTTKDQAETDRLWAALLADGGAENCCGWLKDRFGLSWQIVPEHFLRRFNDPDRAAAKRAFEAMTRMIKLDIAALEAAFKGE